MSKISKLKRQLLKPIFWIKLIIQQKKFVEATQVPWHNIISIIYEHLN
jgi:hypothetical protein